MKILRTLTVFILIVLISVGYGFYNSEGFAHILRAHYSDVSYYYICMKLTKDEPDVIKESQRIVDYIHQNVFTGPFAVKDLPPLNNLIRGIGWCDQVSHLFIRLVEPLDVKGYLVFLNREKDGTGSSPHSVAVITPRTKDTLAYEDFIKEGVVVDALQGVIFRNSSGKEARFRDICSDDILESQQKYFSERSPSRQLYCNMGRAFLSNTPISLASRKRRQFYRYIYPFLPEKIIHLYQEMALNRWYKRSFSDEIDFLYFKARNYHIYERFGKAKGLYDIIIKKSADKKLISECLFFQGMLFYRMRKLDKAKENFEKIIKYYPDSSWFGLAQKWLQE